jgi:hypothetical protein
MLKPLTRLLTLTCFVSLLAPEIINFTVQIRSGQAGGSATASVAVLAGLSGLAGVLTLIFSRLMKAAGPYLEAGAQQQGDFLRVEPISRRD